MVVQVDGERRWGILSRVCVPFCFTRSSSDMLSTCRAQEGWSPGLLKAQEHYYLSLLMQTGCLPFSGHCSREMTTQQYLWFRDQHTVTWSQSHILGQPGLVLLAACDREIQLPGVAMVCVEVKRRGRAINRYLVSCPESTGNVSHLYCLFSYYFLIILHT